MANTFSLKNIVSKNKYNKGTAATVRYDVVELGKPGADDWFKIYPMGDNGLDDYPNVMISKVKDPEGKLNPYLIAGTEDFRAVCAERLSRVQDVKLLLGITTHKKLFVWPLVVVEDLNEGIGWHISGYEIAKAGFTRWTQIRSDKPNNRYQHIDLDDQDQVPKLELFEKPPLDYETALNKAFKDRVINSEDHPVYKNAGSVVPTEYSKNQMRGTIKS